METDPNATALSDIFLSHKINMVKQRWGCIYKLTNTLNGKYYFGKTVQFKTRMLAHKNSKNLKTYLSHAIRKYGWDNFKQEILIDDVPEEDLNQLEISYIEIHDSTNPKKGYNLTKGGDGTSGFKFTDQTKKKICMANKKHSAEKGSISFSQKSKKMGSEISWRKRQTKNTSDLSQRKN